MERGQPSGSSVPAQSQMGESPRQEKRKRLAASRAVRKRPSSAALPQSAAGAPLSPPSELDVPVTLDAPACETVAASDVEGPGTVRKRKRIVVILVGARVGCSKCRHDNLTGCRVCRTRAGLVEVGKYVWDHRAVDAPNG